MSTTAEPLATSSPEELTDRGVALAEKGQRKEAIAFFGKALHLDPSYARAHHNLGVAFSEEGRLDEALTSLTEAIRLRPDYEAAFMNLGSVCHRMGKYEEATDWFRRTLGIRPDHAEALNSLGMSLFSLGEYGEAIVALQQAVRLQPDFQAAFNNLGMALTEAREFAAASAALERALQLNPRYPEAHNNLGNNYKEQGRLAEAIACYDMAIAYKSQSASPQWNRALARLQQGDYARGWMEYEWRLKKPDCGVRRFPQPMWDGSPLMGRAVLLHMEQGLGDMFHFIRYAAEVRGRGGRVTVSCPSKLLRICGRCAGVDAVVDEKSELPPFDVHAPLMSLPALLKTTLDTIPAKIPYLFADETLVSQWKDRLATIAGFRVGACWQGNPRYRGDRERSFTLAHLEPLACVPGVSLISLQWGPGKEQLAAGRQRFPIVDLGDNLDREAGGFMDTAAVLKNLDLVVTADTAMAHLSGALGVPVWIALPWAADWRWLTVRDDSPWYPTARLFRQRQAGDWADVFQRITEQLQERLATAPDTRSVGVEIGIGELVDKLTILEIKNERINDPEKRINVGRELMTLLSVYQGLEKAVANLPAMRRDLKALNAALWDIEDRIRACERAGEFGENFIALARSVYKTNDRRAELKRRINDIAGSCIVEEKSYQEY
jgi:Flp pilus assembly protein TadD